MPFDGTGHEGPIQALEKMDGVIDLLARPDRWCKRQLRTPDGRRCILGAMMAVDGTVALKGPILLAIKQVTARDYLRIEMFNDHPLTTHALVMQVLHQARANIVSDWAARLDSRASSPGLKAESTLRPVAYLKRILRLGHDALIDA
jgi:hypothetical protein